MLNKVTTEEITKEIDCELDVVAKDRTSKADKVITEDKYELNGVLKDNDDTLLKNKYFVVYSSEPHYVKTDDYGFIHVTGLEKGIHEIYYLGDEIVDSEDAIDSAYFTTANTKVTFNIIKMEEIKIGKEDNEEITITLDPKEGTVSESTITTSIYKLGSILPIPIGPNVAYEFIGWFDGEKEISENTILTKSMNLEARWNVKDTDGPEIKVLTSLSSNKDRPTTTTSSTYNISGSVEDISGIKSFKINDTDVDIVNGEWNYTVNLSNWLVSKITIESIDEADNKSTEERYLYKYIANYISTDRYFISQDYHYMYASGRYAHRASNEKGIIINSHPFDSWSGYCIYGKTESSVSTSDYSDNGQIWYRTYTTPNENLMYGARMGSMWSGTSVTVQTNGSNVIKTIPYASSISTTIPSDYPVFPGDLNILYFFEYLLYYA